TIFIQTMRTVADQIIRALKVADDHTIVRGTRGRQPRLWSVSHMKSNLRTEINPCGKLFPGRLRVESRPSPPGVYDPYITCSDSLLPCHRLIPRFGKHEPHPSVQLPRSGCPRRETTLLPSYGSANLLDCPRAEA